MQGLRVSTVVPAMDRRDAAFALLALVLLAPVFGWLVVGQTSVAVLAGLGLLAIGVAFADFAVLAAVAVPASLLMLRVGGLLSAADLVLAASAIVALTLVRASDLRPMQPILWAAVFFMATLVPTMILNRYTANYVEWFHELFQVIGALILGFAIGVTGKARLALGSYVFLCCILGVTAGVVAVGKVAEAGGLVATELPYFNKNFLGSCLAVAVIVCYARPVWLGWSRLWTNVALICCTVGLVASYSRQALVAAAVGIVMIRLVRDPGAGKRTKLVWLAVVPVVGYIVWTVHDQVSSGVTDNSSAQRLVWFEKSVDIWQISPLFGVGERWWYTDRFADSFQPPNMIFEMLTATGVVGLFGLLVLFAVAIWNLWHMDSTYGSVALAVVVAKLAQGQLDLFWIATGATLLWIITGIAYGVQAADRKAEQAQPDDDLAERSPPLQPAGHDG